MRKLLAGLVLVFVPAGLWAQAGGGNASATSSASAPGAPPLHPATEDQVREYLSLLGLERITHEMLGSTVKAMQTTAAPYYPASFWADINDSFQKLEVTKIYLPLYQKYVSQEEMQTAITFYRSPAGQKMLSVQPLISEDAKAVMRARGAEIGAAVYAKHKDEIEAAKKNYEQQHSTPPEIQIPK